MIELAESNQVELVQKLMQEFRAIKLALFIWTWFLVFAFPSCALAGDVGEEAALENIAILIDLGDKAIVDKEFVCETLVELLTDPSKASWGLVVASRASCDPKAEELKVRPHELWHLKIVGGENSATWTIERPINPASHGKNNSEPTSKTEAIQVLNTNSEVRQSFYTDENSLAIMLGSIVQQLPFFRVDSALTKNNEDREIPLPAWQGNLDNVYVCLVSDWQLFSTYLRSVNTSQRKLCRAQNTWKLSSVTRGSLTKQVGTVLAANIEEKRIEIIEIKSKTGPIKKPIIGVSLLAGSSLCSTKLVYGNVNKYDFGGIDTSFMADYYGIPVFSRNKTMQMNISLGINSQSLSAPVLVLKDNTKRTLSLASLRVRGQAGLNLDFLINYRITINPFLDYGLSGKYKITGASIPLEYKYKASMNYGSIFSGEYRFRFGLKAGLNTNLFFGTFALDKQDLYSENKKVSVFGYSGNLYAGWNI